MNLGLSFSLSICQTVLTFGLRPIGSRERSIYDILYTIDTLLLLDNFMACCVNS